MLDGRKTFHILAFQFFLDLGTAVRAVIEINVKTFHYSDLVKESPQPYAVSTWEHPC